MKHDVQALLLAQNGKLEQPEVVSSIAWHKDTYTVDERCAAAFEAGRLEGYAAKQGEARQIMEGALLSGMFSVIEKIQNHRFIKLVTTENADGCARAMENMAVPEVLEALSSDAQSLNENISVDHVCEKCGSIGWKANCDFCIPY